MVKHIVFFKLIENSQKTRELVKNRLLALEEKIEVLKDIEVGLNFADQERAYDIALITVFKDKDDLKTYANHTDHLEVVKFIKEVAVSSKVVDFTY